MGGCHSWMNRFRKLLVRHEKKARNYLALAEFACCLAKPDPGSSRSDSRISSKTLVTLIRTEMPIPRASMTVRRIICMRKTAAVEN
jgi:hypothetical protein